MPAGETYDSVPVRVERRDDQGMYYVGVVIDGAVLNLAQIKTGYVDELVERARAKAEQESQQTSES
jgi:hypothetical protein